MPILTDEFLSKYKNIQPTWGYNGLGYIVYKRTYARPILNEKNEIVRFESWWETVRRCIEGAQDIGAQYTKKEAERLFDLVFNLKCNFGGRMLWQLGTETIKKWGLASLLNCWFVSMREPDDFCFLFEHLMMGGGVGFSVKREDVHDLPRIQKDVIIKHECTKDADFIVPDSREGWVNLLRKVLESFFVTGKSFTYSTILVRGSGEVIKGFGGVASGPIILIDGLNDIVKIFQAREGKKLRSIDVLDICNIIGSVVVSGNVRRSAQIAIGDPDDYLYLRAKRWDLGNIPNWRAMSNNSIFIDDYKEIDEVVWEGFKGNGEPYGFINLALARKYGRMGEERADSCEGTNPCGEITLSDGEACNLCEIYLNNVESKEELIECATLLYKTQKAIWTLPALYKKTDKIVKKNMRIGLGVTGVCQSMEKLEWLDEAYKSLRKFDKQWSKERGWPESIKLTTVKPSGTLSLLSGSTPGAHPAYAEFYIRRVRMAANDPLVPLCREHGYHVEYVLNFDGTENRNTVIVEFPCKTDKTALLAKNTTAIQQLEVLKKMQTVWSDNSVSITVYYKHEELDAIREWLKQNYKNSIKSVSFLLHNEHGFKQAPYEEITEDKYKEMIAKVKPFKKEEMKDTAHMELKDSMECSSGHCPIK
jgi:ribonucleotide reductase alpha subunit